MTGIPFAVLQAQAEEKERNKVTEVKPQPTADAPVIQPPTPSGTLKLCLPCLDDDIEVGQQESTNEDDSSVIQGPAVANHWLKNMELVNHEGENVGLDDTSVSSLSSGDDESIASFSEIKEVQDSIPSSKDNVTQMPHTWWSRVNNSLIENTTVYLFLLFLSFCLYSVNLDRTMLVVLLGQMIFPRSECLFRKIKKEMYVWKDKGTQVRKIETCYPECFMILLCVMLVMSVVCMFCDERWVEMVQCLLT